MATAGTITERFVDALFHRAAVVDATDRDKARTCLLDHVGVTLAGAHDLRERNVALLQSLSPQGGPVPVIGLAATADPITAALITGMCAHQLELDDGHRFGMVHPGATVISALLPLANAHQSSGAELLKGIVVGYEAAIRLAMALQPSMKHKGYHATGTCGSIGAAMGAAAMLGFSRQAMLHTLAAACTQASGILEVIRDGSELKPFNAGHAAMHAVVSVAMGRAGFGGPADVLGGKQGLLTVLSDAPKPEVLVAGADERAAIHGIYVKPYAACRHCHAPVEAALHLRHQHGLEPAQVAQVKVDTYGLAVHLHDHTRVQGAGDAKMSTPYSVAAALVAGEVGMAQFSDAYLADSELLRIMGSVVVQEDPAMSAKVPHQRGARVEVTTTDGRRWTSEVELPKGEPENPMAPAEFVDKFKDLARYAGRSVEQVSAIFDAVMNVEHDLQGLFAQLADAPQ